MNNMLQNEYLFLSSLELVTIINKFSPILVLVGVWHNEWRKYMQSKLKPLCDDMKSVGLWCYKWNRGTVS